MVINRHVKNLLSLFPFEIPFLVNWMILIPDTFPGSPIGRWTSLNGTPTGPQAPSLGHSIPKGLGHDLVPCVGWVNFHWVGLIALNKEQPRLSLKCAVKVCNPDAAARLHFLEGTIENFGGTQEAG